jgi:hypothetical protein
LPKNWEHLDDGGFTMTELMNLNVIEQLTKIVAVFIGGAWVYFGAIRGRTFIPRLKPQISGKLLGSKGKQYLLVDLLIENAGSSIAKICEGGTGLIVNFQKAIGDGKEATDLATIKRTTFSVFNLDDGENRKIEPNTTIYSQELIEVPKGEYDAFRIVFRVNAPPTYWFDNTSRKWRAIAVVPE